MRISNFSAKFNSSWYALFLVAALALFGGRAAAQQPHIANTGGNNPPHAITGPNQKIGVHPNVLAVPTLDGSPSFDPDFDPITYQWKDPNGMVIGTGPTVQVTIAFLGTYIYTLTVCDTHINSQGQTLHACASTSTTVEVVQDVSPPLVDAPDITVSVTDPGSATVSKSTSLSNYMLSGATTSAVDDVDSSPHFLRVVANNVTVDGSTVFPEGDTPVLVFYADQAGNAGSSAATVHVVDRLDNDIYIQNGVGNCFGTPCNDVIQRIRGGVVEDFCDLAGGAFPLLGMILDSSGRAVSLRVASIAGSSGLEMVRCNVKGAPPEKFAFFQYVAGGGLPPGYPEPFPGLQVVSSPPGGGGLSLARLREVVIDDHQNNGNPFVINEDAYMLDLVIRPSGQQVGTNQPVIYHVKQDFWENGAALGATLSQVSVGSPGATLYFHSGATYATQSGCLDRTKIPLSIHAMGTLGGVNFNLQLGLFGSSGEICGRILDNVSGPHPIIPPCTGPAPTDGSGLAVMDGFYALLFDDYKGYGLTLISNSGATGSNGVLNAFSELPFDDPGNPGNFFQNPFFGCAPTAEVRYDPLIPTPSGTGFWGPSFVASTPMGLVGTTPFSNGGEVFTMDPGKATPIATGIGYVGAVTAWPPNVSAGAAISVLIRIDSPVDVLVTDPNGKKLGMESGMPVNDFGSDGSDTGAGSHPRFYAINNPVPGDYIVQSVGTGTGPYTVHVYSVDTSKPFGQHIFRSGNAAPGALSSQNFTFGAGGGITFTNHPPTANAGPDQTVNAAANGTATVNLDGSLSSDPDGDPLTFTWAGPFGSVSGAQPQVILTGSVNVLQLTVDDGKGGTASANVTITVNSQGDTTPPVLTLPPTITREATSPAGAAVSYSATALDNVDGSVTPSCIPPAGSIFPLGTTTVNCTATDSSGNASSGSFKVIVQDTTAPIVTPPAGITVPATEATGARGNAFPALAAFLAGGSAVDIADPAPARLSPQVNGTGVDINTLFPLGTTNVAFLFRDASGNIGAASSTVTVILGKPIIAGMVSGQSKAGAEGSMYVDIMVTNTGTGNARNVRFSSLTLKTLRGTGTVKIDTKQSPPLPIVIGSLNAGVSAKIRLYFIVPKTVSQFSISGRGNLTDVTGKVIEIGTTETVTP